MQPEVQSNDVHSHQWFEVRLLWDHHSCQYQVFTGGSAKNNFVLFWTLWMLIFAKLVQCIILSSFKKLVNFPLFLCVTILQSCRWVLFCSTRASSLLEYFNKPHRCSHDHTLPLPLPLTKPMANMGWCPFECAELHLLVPCLFADSRKGGILNPIPDAERTPAEIIGFFACFFYVPKLLSSALPLLSQLLFLFPSVNKVPSSWIQDSHAPCLQLWLPDQTDRLKKQRLLNPHCETRSEIICSVIHTHTPSTDSSGHGMGVLILIKASAGL